ncbi:MAG: DMT family transporter [Calditrichia bacterium]
MDRILKLIFLSIVWGTTWVAIKYSLHGFPPFLGASLRFTVAMLVLVGYAWVKGISLKIPEGSFRYIFICATLLYLLDYGVIYWGEQYLYAGVTAIFFATFPIFTGLLSAFVFKTEPLRINTILGLLVAFVGIAIIFYDQFLLTDFSGLTLIASIGIIVSALSAALSVLIVKKHLSHVEIIPLTLHQMFWGTLTLIVGGFLRGETLSLQLDTAAIIAVLYMGIIASALAFVLYYSLLKQMSPTSLSLIIYVTPLVGILSGWMFLDEKITSQIIIGSALILFGIAVSQYHDLRKSALAK